uniref:Ada2 n=1 Tax=Arundo donax TaxID=35708 RepID=A0A0A9CTE8_ARUDO
MINALCLRLGTNMLCNFSPVSQPIHFNSLKKKDFLICIPVGTNKREREVIHHPVRMIASMRGDFCADGEALHAEVEVWALGALDSYLPRDVLIAVVAVVKRLLAPALAGSPAGRGNGVRGIPARRDPPPLRPVAGVIVAGIRHPAGPPHRAAKP